MIRTTLDKAYIKRTIRPLYGWTQATPKSGYLDPAWTRSTDIWPGMVAMKTTGENYTLINATGVPAGLFGNYIGGDGIDEPLDQGINAIGVWVLGPDAEFQILSPAFDSALAWVDPGDGTDALIYARTASAAGADPAGTIVNGQATGLRGQLVPAGAVGASAQPVARLISVDSANQITIGGLTARHAL